LGVVAGRCGAFMAVGVSPTREASGRVGWQWLPGEAVLFVAFAGLEDFYLAVVGERDER